MQAAVSDPRESTGFTLVELMVVIALMGVMAALIVPEMRGTYGDALLRSGARAVTEVCAMAAARAVSFQRPHRVHLDAATGRFRVERQSGGRGLDAVFVPVREVSGGEGRLGGGITVRVRTPEDEVDSEADASAGLRPGRVERGGGDWDLGPLPGVMFYPDGTADGAEILLRDADGFGLVLRVHPVTGRVRVMEVPRGER